MPRVHMTMQIFGRRRFVTAANLQHCDNTVLLQARWQERCKQLLARSKPTCAWSALADGTLMHGLHRRDMSKLCSVQQCH